MYRNLSSSLVGCALVLLVAFHASAQAPRTTRVSVAFDGGEANVRSWNPRISRDGRLVTFCSDSGTLVADDRNGVSDAFVVNVRSRIITRVSVNSVGVEGNGSSCSTAISGDGRYVVFESAASNLVAADTNGQSDVFVHDRQTGITTRVSIASDGTQGNSFSAGVPVISADGRYVAFGSPASNLVAGDTNGEWDVFVHDRHTGMTTRVSMASDGTQSNGESQPSGINDDGTYVLFSSLGSNLVAGDANGTWDDFVYDRSRGITTRVSVATGGGEGAGHSYGGDITADGQLVSFVSWAPNLVHGDTNGTWDNFVHDRRTGATTRVDVATNGAEPPTGCWNEPALSADGRYVAFACGASNLVADDFNSADDVFLHDLQTGITHRVSVASNGAEPSGGVSEEPALSESGRYVAFTSRAVNLVADDTNGVSDVFVRDRGSWPSDFEGDRVSDATVFRPSSGVWYQLRSSTGNGYGVAWGMNGDVPAPGDYDGDGTSDPAVFRPSTGTWFLLLSTTGSGVGVPWGLADDVPVPADYDGDGKTDVAVWRPSTGVWYIIRSSTNSAVGISWGITGDVPVPADFDGDGKADPTVFRGTSGTWYELRSTTGAGVGVTWGQADDVPLVGDYDRDGKADPTVFRARTGTWYELRSTTGIGYGVLWGTVDDIPVVGDYDGDGKADPAVFRPSTSTWYQLRSTTGAGFGVIWGATGDVPQ